MNCQIHYQQIKFVCRSDNCYFLPLCQVCLAQHSKQHHNNESIPLSKALQLAFNNLSKQQDTLKSLLEPFDKRKEITQKIEQQRILLMQQKERLVRYIEEYIKAEESKLMMQNSNIFVNQQRQFEKDLKDKLHEIDQLLKGYQRRPLQLQKSLNLQLESYLQNLSKSHKNLYGNSQFKYYSSVTHEIILSKLELTSGTITKPFRKIMNESPLYFLIDSSANTSNFLFNFNPSSKQEIQIYNLQDHQWSCYKSNYEISQQGSPTFDKETNTFFWVGGIQKNSYNNKSGTIVAYSLNQPDKANRWKQYQLTIPRSSCMAAAINLRDGNGVQVRGILVVGGVSQKGQILKSCEYLNLLDSSSQTVPFGGTNFAAFSGTLLMFNNSTLLRLGGLGKSKDDYSVIQVVEKLDLQQAFFNWEKDKVLKAPRWSYIELDLPKGDYLSKPKLFYANQAAIQINPNEVFVFGGLDSGIKGVSESYLIGVEEFSTHSRDVKEKGSSRQQKFSVRWVNEKRLISEDDFSSKPTIWKERLYCLQNMGSKELLSQQKRLLQFDMYQWYETENILPL